MLYHELQCEGGNLEGLGALKCLMDIVVGTGCAKHDTQHELTWGLAWMDFGGDTTKKLFFTIETPAQKLRFVGQVSSQTSSCNMYM